MHRPVSSVTRKPVPDIRELTTIPGSGLNLNVDNEITDSDINSDLSVLKCKTIYLLVYILNSKKLYISKSFYLRIFLAMFARLTLREMYCAASLAWSG